MCQALSQTVQNEVIKELGRLTSANEMFTAFDVTKRVRKIVNDATLAANAHKENIPNEGVRDMIHNAMSSGNFPPDYIKEQRLLAGGQMQVFVFLPQSRQSERYDEQHLDPSNTPVVPMDPAELTAQPVAPDPAATSIDPTTASAPAQSAAPKDPTLRAPDLKGRITVPNDQVRALGLKCGDIVMLINDNGAMKIVDAKAKTSDGQAGALYTVDGSDNVRIAVAVLEKIGNTGARIFKTTLASPEIIITPVNPTPAVAVVP